MITIIDYKSGNLRSISNGFKKIGTDEIFKIANEDKKRLDTQEKKDEKFSELYYRTSLFQE